MAFVSAGRDVQSPSADDEGVWLPQRIDGVLTVSLDGRYVWSFQPTRDGRVVPRVGPRVRVVRWPDALRHHLDGTARVQVVDHSTGEVHLDREVAFGAGAGRVRVTDRHGHPLAVNKVGNLTRVFAETDEAARRAILTGTAAVLTDLREHGGVAAYLNYGCLLGAVREGRMIAHDCDTDVCYLSDHTDPIDVILESYRLERMMAARGWRTVRMSGGDFKVLLPLDDGRTCYVDVFAAFTVGDTFYQLGNRSGRLAREAIVPTRTMVLEGVELPVPRDPEAMLAFVYGPGWRVPDPAFRFADRPEGIRRLDGWLRGFRTEQPHWNTFFRSPRVRAVPEGPSELAQWARRRMETRDLVADIGCGTGRDSRYFADHGHPVLAYDVSPDARRLTGKRLTGVDTATSVRRLVLNELRTAAVTGAEIAASGRPRHVFARQVAGCVDDEGRRNLWRLARTALADAPAGSSLLVEVSASGPGLPPPAPPGLVRRVDVTRVVAELEGYGGRVIVLETRPGQDMFDQPDPLVCRLQVVFDSKGDDDDG